MIERGEKRGLLKSGSTIIEATSGNTGIALAMVAAAKGYKMLVVMPEHMTGERIRLMTNLGAELCLTPKEEGFEGAVARAMKIAANDHHTSSRTSSATPTTQWSITTQLERKSFNKWNRSQLTLSWQESGQVGH
jgi:cysteine synthase